jgi:polyphosphate kinase
MFDSRDCAGGMAETLWLHNRFCTMNSSLHHMSLEHVSSDLFFHRESSLLEFNMRVLAQAADARIPLMERLRFLTISSNNLDEFFEIRVAALLEQLRMNSTKTGPDGLSPALSLEKVLNKTHLLVSEQYTLLNRVLLPAMKEAGVLLLTQPDWTPEIQAYIRTYFIKHILPVLTPIVLDPAHPFPHVHNKGLNIILSLRGEDAFGREAGYAILPVPRTLPRVIALPQALKPQALHACVLLSSVILANVALLFEDVEITDISTFRVTRNSELWLDENAVDDLLSAVEGELPRRNQGDAVRLEVQANCPNSMVQFLLEEFNLNTQHLFKVEGPVNLHRLGMLCDIVKKPSLFYAPYTPPLYEVPKDIFADIRKKDILLHHPFESFAPTLAFLQQAAEDPSVLAIKQTLYRTGEQSPVVDALIHAAHKGKEVTAVVELMARFDEAANVALATRLQEAGVNVVYGVVGYKTHAKMILVIRQEGQQLRRYVHLSTGNYHSRTTRLYTDFALLSADASIGKDVATIFLQLTSFGKARPLKALLQAPFQLHQTLLEHIAVEAEHARQGRKALIMARVNALTEPGIIHALYEASQAGVEIQLLVRGMCCLRPGVAGLSENIHVRSVLGRFLEHSRVFYFYAHGEEKLYASSADWMPRNLFKRIEIAFPILQPHVKKRVLEEGLLKYFSDNTQAWVLQPDGSYERAEGHGDLRCAQKELMFA